MLAIFAYFQEKCYRYRFTLQAQKGYKTKTNHSPKLGKMIPITGGGEKNDEKGPRFYSFCLSAVSGK